MSLPRPTHYLLLLMFLLSGCVGFIKFNSDYVEVKTEFKTKDQVLAKVGKPQRIAQEGELEVWHYLLSKPIANDDGRPVMGSGFMAALIVIQIWWKKNLDENVRFVFQGENVISVSQLKAKDSGFMCNAIGMHPFGDAGCRSAGH